MTDMFTEPTLGTGGGGGGGGGEALAGPGATGRRAAWRPPSSGSGRGSPWGGGRSWSWPYCPRPRASTYCTCVGPSAPAPRRPSPGPAAWPSAARPPCLPWRPARGGAGHPAPLHRHLAQRRDPRLGEDLWRARARQGPRQVRHLCLCHLHSLGCRAAADGSPQSAKICVLAG